MIDRKERRFQEFAAFLAQFVHNLNQMTAEGWAVLVEGRRDELALRGLGYEGILLTVASLAKYGNERARAPGKVVILTDLDREGAVLASRFVKKLTHEGVRTSLAQRRRLKAASKGTFRHIENLGRFANSSGYTSLSNQAA